ncbi:ABC transporter ATP-binding protein [Azospirillum canadense]|uniref:ABC transporter ATP-binding protein n=1 Tax=Azospirillum canadense TaxID=403962 RepID=UPI00222747CD|nr:oligopeptide/dipeptide ABC transporter ATP-binding protein [Azospirillum canadense]MCW2240518.1 oligopeptide/dipeptide ABC transporter ATP-binding protein [Azospirillum canadense]
MTTALPLPLLSVRGLSKSFVHRNWCGRVIRHIPAVADVGFDVARGRTLGLVGESGCGKSTTGRLVLRLIEADAGDVRFDGVDIRAAAPARMRTLRRDMQLIFQDPYSSLNPRLTIGGLIEEGLIVHGVRNRGEREDRVAAVLRRVGIRPEYMGRYPNEFSGGQRQRIGIARALVLRPRLIVADEPVSALDVSVQAQVLNLLAEIQEEFGLTAVFIAHDMAVVEHVSEEIAVMYRGRIVERGRTEEVIADPLHPYTRALLDSVPSLRPRAPRRARPARDDTDGERGGGGCPFRARCDLRMPICRMVPPNTEVRPGRVVACHLHQGQAG